MGLPNALRTRGETGDVRNSASGARHVVGDSVLTSQRWVFSRPIEQSGFGIEFFDQGVDLLDVARDVGPVIGIVPLRFPLWGKHA